MNTDKLKKHDQVHRPVTQADIDGNAAMQADNLKVGDMAWFEVSNSKEAAEAKYQYVTEGGFLLRAQLNEMVEHERKAFQAGAQWQEQQDRWVPISEYPKENPVVQRWHIIYKCIVSVSHRRAYATDGLEWVTGTLDHMWPDAAFEPYFKPLPKAPTK